MTQAPKPSDDDAGRVSRRVETPVGMPRWVKISGIVLLLLAILLVVLLLSGHRPGNHMAGGATAAEASSVVAPGAAAVVGPDAGHSANGTVVR